MRGRLGVAAAMLGDPDVLVLDEPANGLDPEGIALMRELLVSYGRSGRTVLVSSHHLADIERMCDRVAVMNHGRVVASGTIAELTGRRPQMSVRVGDPLGALGVLLRAGIGADGGLQHGQLLVDVPPGGGETVNRVLVEEGFVASELLTLPTGLEETYLSLTGPTTNGRSPASNGHGSSPASTQHGGSSASNESGSVASFFPPGTRATWKPAAPATSGDSPQ